MRGCRPSYVASSAMAQPYLGGEVLSKRRAASLSLFDAVFVSNPNPFHTPPISPHPAAYSMLSSNLNRIPQRCLSASAILLSLVPKLLLDV